MKVLFVASSRAKHFSLPPHVEAQRDSLAACGMEIESFLVTSIRGMGFFKTLAKLRRRIREGGYDVIHAHYVYNGLLALLAGGRRRTLVSFMGSDINGISQPCGKGVTLVGRINQWISILAVRLAQRSIVKSEEMQLRVPVRLRHKVDVIPNGVDFDVFRPLDREQARERLGLESDKTYVLFMGNPADPNKNVVLAREALARMKSSAELLCPYPTEKENVVYYMNAADVVVLTSLREGSPNVVKEAMACARPMVSVQVGDAMAVVEDTPGCRVVGYDEDEIAQALDMAVAFDGSTTGRSAVRHLRREVVADRIVDIYKTMGELT